MEATHDRLVGQFTPSGNGASDAVATAPQGANGMVQHRSTIRGDLHSTEIGFPPPPQEIDDSPGLVIDLTTDETRLELDTRQLLGSDAALLAASKAMLRVKRTVDVVGSMALLILLSPLLLITAVAIKLTSPGPIFFRQPRAGKDGREFTFYKFRSMCVDAVEKRDGLIEHNEATGPVFKIREDPRMTTIGRFIRQTSIDELPQLWNVLKGDMSLVGPRPLPIEEAVQCSDWELQRLRVVPGITAIWQVSGRSELDFETWVQMDIEYIENWSLWLDLKLLAKTIPAVLSRQGAY